MKHFILLFALFIGLFANAQDVAYLNSLKSLPTQEAVIQVTNNFIKESNDKLRFYKSKDFTEHSIFLVQYVPENLTDEEIEKSKDELSDQFVIFQFKYWNDGEDKDLKIAGTKKYVFSDVRGQYLNLFPFWQKHVDPTADKMELSKKGNSYKQEWTFSGSNGNWKIRG